ncbi:ATP phosphoribosyltransferase [[Clostridium] methylpentosum DSM 5476]|jgi:ATP phosphoribosyltransferase|uniref:ATP phosphoribosyltransferase n=1 Tax=[Clostridium] methylpentosum DSM 5476 TaxID=537013 RepID=C0ECF5_9FIRM|nr:ATP phosphoribosyltransferase [[Clostridium] methylpentosum DSM 5476]MDY3989435.1 ATP phosphoribosyltransferase [Massilioclostridium sp.]MEE1491682.1 ATP phosphoribosyltransferase [Massilioclostridium sp.]
MLNIALPKGRLGDKVYELFSSIGYDCKSIYEDNRKLVFENKENGVRYLLVKPSDVAIYVEHGAADVGVVGKDILLESDPDIYELLDLGLGKCRVAVASKNDYHEDTDTTLRVATKYVNIAKRYYASINREIEIIKLNGSIELAPILGLSDVIVDIVETGSTLKENNLRVFTDIVDISARFIANKSSFKFKNDRIDEMVSKLAAALEQKKGESK